MGSRPKSSASQKNSFLIELARLGLRRALRPFLHRSNPPFIAALVLPPKALPYIYVDAANELFTPNVKEFEISDDFRVIYLEAAEREDLDSKFRTSSVLRRTVFLLQEECKLPTEFALAVDHYGVMPPPSAEHVMRACRHAGLGEIGRTDAELLASTSPHRLKAALTIGRPIASAVRRLRNVEEPPPEDHRKLAPTRIVTALDNLVGFEEVKVWAAALGHDLAAWQEGSLPWPEVDRGALIVGPPGTGKTKLAAAIAAACGLNFLPTSAAKWQSKGHLGDFLRAMRADFKAASEKAPCLMFLEELDSVGDREADRSDNTQYTRTAVNGVLEAVDEVFAKEGVVIVGASNKLEAIEPALLRSGRIERKFPIGLPTPDQRLSILSLYLRPHELALPEAFVRLVSNGMSGADMEKIAREAKRRARMENRPLSVDDVLRFLPSVRPFDREELRRIAVHEAGHALVGLKVLPHRLVGVTINDSEVIGPSAQSIGRTTFDRVRRSQMLVSDYLADAAMLMGGIAAEELVFGSYSDGAGGLPGSDLDVATELVTRMELQLGLGASLVSEVNLDGRNLQTIRVQRPDIAARVGTALRAQFDRAKEIISENRAALDYLVAALVEHKSLRGELVIELVDTAQRVDSRAPLSAKRAKAGKSS
jgi:cell division protease FtsH